MIKRLMKLTVIVALFAVTAALFCACGDEVEQVDISSIAEIKTADGVSYAYAETTAAAAKDKVQLNTWYTDYYKDLRDNGDIVSLVVRYTDDPGHATLFSGINVYTGCEIDDDDNAAMNPHEMWYHTESERDRVLIEVDE